MTTYATLQTDIADYLHRTDLTAQIPGFIARAESAMFRELNVKDIQTMVDDTTDEDFITLPTDFAFVIRLTTTVGGVEHTLDYVSPTDAYTGDQSTKYTFEQGGIRILGAGNGTAYQLYYTPAISALSSTLTTNWLLDNAPDLYLYASCLEGAKYTQDAEQISILSGMTGALLDSVRRLTNRKYLPAGSLQIKTRG